MQTEYDALIVVSFGGPERPDDVMPFLENVTRGRGIPRERLTEVAEHYYHFDGKSPINDQNRELIASLRALFSQAGDPTPVYWGNRNWHPFLTDTIRQMKNDGIRRASAYITSAFASYSGCRQYREDIVRACEEVGEGAPDIVPVALFHDQPGFIQPMAENLRSAAAILGGVPRVAFTAHSVPMSMADTSPYVRQLEAACETVAREAGISSWQLVYQSRSGPPTQPWLEPDILDHIRDLHAKGCRELVIAPVGFVSDHMEVMYDLDTEAAELCRELDMRMVRAATVGVDPQFIGMIRELMTTERKCALNCCPRPLRPTSAASARPAAETVPRGS